MQPDILLIMCDQLRYDALACNGNGIISTPNLDRLAARGAIMDNAYSTCPVCLPARYTVRTGREPATTGLFENGLPTVQGGRAADMQERCGKYLGFAMRERGYSTFVTGKMHTYPDMMEPAGYDIDERAEEMWGSAEEREKDAYMHFMHTQHPEFNFVEQPHGERTDMYYMPQTSHFPAELTVESFVADRAIEAIGRQGDKPYFGFISFMGPHPPCAPPIPYNRMYNPDEMPLPVLGNKDTDAMDEQLAFHNHLIWADGLNDFMAQQVKAKYYGEISYIDSCIGRILDAVEARGNADNTLIVFCSDHGDNLGDHGAWQKESYFEGACHIPMLISWPAVIAPCRSGALVCHSDIYTTVTSAAGKPEVRDGMDLLAVLRGATPRQTLIATYGTPGTPQFKMMVREGKYKYILMTNGNREQLFNLDDDRFEQHNITDDPGLCNRMWQKCLQFVKDNRIDAAFDENGIKVYPFTQRPLFRVRQFAYDLGISDYRQK